MASGMTFVDAINELVETIGEFPMSGTTKPSAQSTPDTTSIYFQAERFMNRESQRYQSQGWPENTTLAKLFTSSASKIAIADSVLRVRGAGPDHYRNLVIRDDAGTQRLYDADRESFKFYSINENGHTTEASIFLDVVDELDFEKLTPLLQDVIVAAAKMKFQRRFQTNASIDQQLVQEYMMAEQMLDRNKPLFPQTFNFQPPGTGQQVKRD